MLQYDNKNLEIVPNSLSSKKHCFFFLKGIIVPCGEKVVPLFLKGTIALCEEKAVPAVFPQIHFQVTRICTGFKIHAPIIYFNFILKRIRMKERSIVTIACYVPSIWVVFFFCLFSLHRTSTCDNL